MKHTKEYAETIAATKYLYSQTEDSDLFIKAQEWCIDAYANGYMKAIEETNVAGLLEALKIIVDFPNEDLEHYKTYGVTMSLNELQFNQIINAIKKAE